MSLEVWAQKGPLNCPWALCFLFSALLSLPPPALCCFSGWVWHESPLPSPSAPFRGLCEAPAKTGTWGRKALGQDFPYHGKRRGFLPFGGPGTTLQLQIYREMVMLWVIRASVGLEVVGLLAPCLAGGVLRRNGHPLGSPRYQHRAVLGKGASLPFFMCKLNAFLISSHYFLPK